MDTPKTWIAAILPQLTDEELIEMQEALNSEMFKRVVVEVERDMQEEL
jgi:hypothetical protein